MNADKLKNTMTCQECGTVRRSFDKRGSRAKLACESCRSLTTHEPEGDILPYDDGGIGERLTDEQARIEVGRRIRFLAYQLEAMPTKEQTLEYSDVHAGDIMRGFDDYHEAMFTAFNGPRRRE